MKVPERTWIRYIEALRKINDAAADAMEKYLQTHALETVADKLTASEYAYAIATQFGEGAAAMACEMYDAMAGASGAALPAAEPAATPTLKDVKDTIFGSTSKYKSAGRIPGEIGRLVKRTGVDTTMQNAIRDNAEWAWIPHGDTCPFCIALASRGWQKASRAAMKGDHAEHIHANCDCTYAIRFNKKTEYAGYDPERYADIYNNAEGRSAREKINSLKRAQYAENAQRIRAQKRAAYAERMAESVSAGTLPDKMKGYVPDHDTRMKIIEDGIAEKRPIFTQKDDPLYTLAYGLPEEEGFYTVVLHGYPYGLDYKGQQIDADTLCAIIAQREDYKKGTDIRLISCYTGSEKDGVARYISDKLKVNVLAPDKLGIITRRNGKYLVYSGSKIGKQDGEMTIFAYGGK